MSVFAWWLFIVAIGLCGLFLWSDGLRELAQPAARRTMHRDAQHRLQRTVMDKSPRHERQRPAAEPER